MTKSCENMSSKKSVVFSESEIEVAKLLIQLSINNNNTCSNNSTSSNNKADDDAKSSIVATAARDDDNDNNDDDNDDDEEEDIAYGSKIRYRDIEDIYNATEPVPENKTKRVKY
ncbi:PREDICTED: RNA polymerase-associated protein LEO1-like [Lupinus angustifolius]|uniref:RNA polymerase-associated protein LEO1-like n=1 Tax=Lupinus angustifolius TaxID=3871 RepID=UPI00092E71D8|nr:PREDICTED: RNA polymerase-associated protein LEO1-like [Lupinus angustifolius]